jgi:hypothetical protein
VIFDALCNSCLQPFVVTVGPDEKQLVQGELDADGHCACPRLCGGKLLLGDAANKVREGAQLAKPLHLTGTELFQAIHGLGLPDEVTDDPDLVEALLKTNPVTGAKLEQVMGRVFLHELHLANGMVVHLTAGARGAQLLKVTRRPHA